MNEPIYKISLIVPLYNESKRINVLEYDKFLENTSIVEIIFVNDASIDNTLQILKTIKEKYPEQVEVLSNIANLGKGEAIRKGMIHALAENTAAHLAFMDADLSVPLEDILQFSKTLNSNKPCAVFGVRDLSDTNHIKRILSRKYLSYLFRFYVNIMFQFKISDTQCGAKIFKREIAALLYEKPFETRWLSDLELLLRLKNYCSVNSLRFSEQLIPVPVTYYEDKTGSKLNFFELLRTAYDLIKLSVRYKFFRS